ncbi:MAG TPA: N-acetylmuramoyl-L-alanine amidase [Miltoncostaea sp.]|nr:N-acetylmuramoyl-L-alanine amidase [Miltoncostaea sp.]
MPPAPTPTRGIPIRTRTSVAGVLCALIAFLGVPAGALAALPYVAVDPGHGGGDTGAVGQLPPGTVTGLPPRTDAQGRPILLEKDVNLDIGLRLDAWLRANGGRTLLTRNQDLAGGNVPYTTEGADLKARTDAANAADVDIFVSIHNNAMGSTAGSGTETFHYYYSSAASRTLANAVQTQVVATLGLPDRGVKTAGFYVLRHTTLPAILVEGGFLTNATDVLMLADPNVRQRIAEAVGRGIAAYAAADVAPPPELPPTIGPWATKPARVPAGYRLVKTGITNPVGKGGWLAVIVGFRQPAQRALPATIGPWRTRPAHVPSGYRLVKSGKTNPVGRGGWLAVLKTALPQP